MLTTSCSGTPDTSSAPDSVVDGVLVGEEWLWPRSGTSAECAITRGSCRGQGRAATAGSLQFKVFGLMR